MNANGFTERLNGMGRRKIIPRYIDGFTVKTRKIGMDAPVDPPKYASRLWSS